MINIISQIFPKSDVTIINERVVSGSETGKFQKFDERISEVCINIDTITIDSTIGDINVSVSNSSTIEAHFYGEAIVDGDINFDVRVENCELTITLEFTGNCFGGNLKLDVTIPHKNFKAITVKSLSTDITLNDGVSTDYLKVKTMSGNLKTNATVKNISISTMKGDIKIR